MIACVVRGLSLQDDAGDRQLAAEQNGAEISGLELQRRPQCRQWRAFGGGETKQRPTIGPTMLDPDRLPVLEYRAGDDELHHL
jgi:hypothetical protein